MRFRWRRISKPQVFVVLMIAAAVFVLLPRDYLGPVRNVAQLVASVPQRAASKVSNVVGDEVRQVGGHTVSMAEQEKLNRKIASLTNENISNRARIEQLERTTAALANIRRHMPEGVLVPASVIALDAATGRDSLLLGKGKLSNLKKGDWVASRLLIDAGENDQVKSQSAVLAGECLIGWIEDVSSINARVVLLTDPVASRNVTVAIFRDKQQQYLSDNGKRVSFVLEGAGNGKMRVIDIFHDYIEKGLIAEKDWIVSQPSSQLPMQVLIGRIEKFEVVKQKPVYRNAIVSPAIDPKSLDQVFVVDLSRQPTK